MGENKKLQGELQKLHAREEEYLKTVQAWKEEVSGITLQIDAKISEFKATQTIVVSLLEAPISIELVDTARECVDQIDKDLVELKARFVLFMTRVKEVLKKLNTSASGLGTSHK